MIERCDRCGRISKTIDIMRVFNGKTPIELCKRCEKAWSDLWIKTYRRDSIVTRAGEKTLPIEAEDLWNQFMQSSCREQVDFT